MSEPKLLHRGSVKDIYQIQKEELLFRFSNRYSIFDWGEMPDAIPEKGKALAEMGHRCLHYFNSKNIPTHYLGRGPLAEDLIVKSVHVPRGESEAYAKKPIHTLVPLEVIYRFGAPKGSSLLRKYKTEQDWKSAGFDRAYHEGEDFSELKFDVTTKLEKLDRPLNETEAKSLSGMSDAEWNNLLDFTRTLAIHLKQIFSNAGFKLWDGKFEFAFIPGSTPNSPRQFMLVDSIGLDEIRLTFQGKTLSKELLRQSYLNSSWYEALTRAKEIAPQDFKNYCLEKLKQAPAPLPKQTLATISKVYTLVSEMILEPNETLLSQKRNKLIQALEQLS